MVIVISQPIYNSTTGAFLGVIALQFDAPFLTQSIVNANVMNSDFIYLQLLIYDVKNVTFDPTSTP